MCLAHAERSGFLLIKHKETFPGNSRWHFASNLALPFSQAADVTWDDLFEAFEKKMRIQKALTSGLNWHVHRIPLPLPSYVFLLHFILPAFLMQDKVICVTAFHCISCEMILLHLQHWRSSDPSSHVTSRFLEPFQEIFWVLDCPHAAVPMQRVSERRTSSRGHERLNSWRWNMCCGISFMM